MNIISSMFLDVVKAARDRIGRGGARVHFFVRKVDGRILKGVRGVTREPEIIKDLVRQADEKAGDDFRYIPR